MLVPNNVYQLIVNEIISFKTPKVQTSSKLAWSSQNLTVLELKALLQVSPKQWAYWKNPT